MERTPLSVSSEQLVTELMALLGDGDPARVVMAFDGDGTLWSGDVGEDLFHLALQEAFLLDAARPALLAEAERHGIELGAACADANTIARALFAAYLDGRYPERETCAMMTWCFAGRAQAEVDALASRVLSAAELGSRLVPELLPVLTWARHAGLRCVLISASPRAVVEPAGALRGFRPDDIAAATPGVVSGYVQPELAAPVPYAEAKMSAGRALFADARWLASFGDNVFDIDMLQTAEVGVAVRPKPRLRAQVATLGLRLLAAPADAAVHATAR